MVDRVIIYPAAIPLETDILNTNRNTMVALGRLAMDLLGSSTLVSGLACTQTTVPSMSVAIGAGAIYSLQSVDGSAYSSLPANTTDQIMKQGILPTSANKTLPLTAPGTVGTSVIYLIEAAFSEVDSLPVVLPYYNASNPAVAYSGPGGAGTAQNTLRQGLINIQAKAGTAATSPVAPAVDSGFVPMYYVTVAYGVTSITNSNIAVAAGAPFIPASLSGMMPLAGGTFTGQAFGPTPAFGDSSTKLATTSFAQNALGNLRGVVGSLTTSTTLTASQAGNLIDLGGSGAQTLTLPSPAASVGAAFHVNNFSTGSWSITTPSGNFNGSGFNGSASTISLASYRTCTFVSDGTNWVVFLSAAS